MADEKFEVTVRQLASIVEATFDQAERKMAERIGRRVQNDILEHLQHVGLLDANGCAKPVIFRPRAECYPPLVVQ